MPDKYVICQITVQWGNRKQDEDDRECYGTLLLKCMAKENSWIRWLLNKDLKEVREWDLTELSSRGKNPEARRQLAHLKIQKAGALGVEKQEGKGWKMQSVRWDKSDHKSSNNQQTHVPTAEKALEKKPCAASSGGFNGAEDPPPLST
jgi:hypothetical protein